MGRRLLAAAAWALRGLWRATVLVIAIHGVSLLVRGDEGWRGFWFGLYGVPAWVEAAAELGIAAAVLPWRGRLVWIARAWLLVMSALAFSDALRFFDLLASGAIRTSLPLPMSLALGAALAARAYADGTPTTALFDRTQEGLVLYREGLVPALVFSGGVGEVDCMRRMAREAGVPDAAVVPDAGGLNTRATARNAAAIARERGWSRLLVVSHYYHLPRVKMAFVQEGVDARTVPCRMSRGLSKEPWFVLRECAGFYVYLVGVDALR